VVQEGERKAFVALAPVGCAGEVLATVWFRPRWVTVSGSLALVGCAWEVVQEGEKKELACGVDDDP
jgi:hypothetical protein